MLEPLQLKYAIEDDALKIMTTADAAADDPRRKGFPFPAPVIEAVLTRVQALRLPPRVDAPAERFGRGTPP